MNIESMKRDLLWIFTGLPVMLCLVSLCNVLFHIGQVASSSVSVQMSLVLADHISHGDPLLLVGAALLIWSYCIWVGAGVIAGIDWCVRSASPRINARYITQELISILAIVHWQPGNGIVSQVCLLVFAMAGSVVLYQLPGYDETKKHMWWSLLVIGLMAMIAFVLGIYTPFLPVALRITGNGLADSIEFFFVIIVPFVLCIIAGLLTARCVPMDASRHER